ncbi:hypothetical protein M1146_04360, partial [Patescibacteria group bacterium]|nr:hypothetical protein [Patescibacteria group bacterium]
MNKRILLPIFIHVVLASTALLLSSRVIDISLLKKAEQLKNISIMETIILQKSTSFTTWQVGAPVLVTFVSALFKVSAPVASEILKAIFLASGAILLWYLLSRFKKKTKLYHIIFAIVALVFLSLLGRLATLNTVFLSATLLLLLNLYFDYEILLRSSTKQLIYLEELIIALALICLASISNLVYKLGIVSLLVLFIYFIFLKKKMTLSWLKPLILMILLNPLLVGLALRF